MRPSSHAKLLQSWIAESGAGFKSYVSPRDGSDARFNLRDAVHSVETTRVSKLGLFAHNSRIPAATKNVTIVRWGMNTIPHGKDRWAGFDFEVVSMFDADTGLVLQNKFFLGLDCTRSEQQAAETKASNEAYMNLMMAKQPKGSWEEFLREHNRIRHKNCTASACLHPSFDPCNACTGGK